MKHVTKILIVPLLAFLSCTQQADESWIDNTSSGTNPETHSVGISLSRASIETFAEEGITEIGIYVYLKDSLVFGENLPLGDGNLEVDLPLAENLQTFAVANAHEMIDTDSLSKVIIRQDDRLQKQVYLSDIVDFVSDNSMRYLNLELKRLVGQAVFQPKETEAELSGITQFDQLSITFTNVGVAYKVKTGEAIQEDRVILVDRAAGFGASVYSLPTISAGSRTAIDVVYLQNGEEITRTHSPLDTAIAFEPSKRSIVHMAILDDAYLTNSWTRSIDSAEATSIAQPFTIEESEF